ncbi:coiled-coil domain-containing protein 168 isoform X2 [Trichosurus vulpecula]|uniref:coiled-coil domain-containing protein 168 isoform X2 n=1 Tax=Trichosurus vulpecula TaxID=9337 RepID=UPI00186B4B2C|nr:coiled-coil domain-containing protein 168 isoform X2 [Trichosurus vulpecula]
MAIPTEEGNTFLKNLGYENWPHTQLPPKRRLGALSRSQLLSSLDPQNTEDIINEMLSTSYETWSGTSDNESQLSWPSGSGSQLSFSSEAISSSSFLNSVYRKPPPNYRRFSHFMFETLPLSSRKLLPIRKMCANKNKNVRFSSDHNFLKKSKVTLENDDLDLTPCPSAHLYLPRNQIRLLEENLRNQIPSKSQPVIKIKTTYQSSNFAKLNQAPLYPSEETSCKREKMLQEPLFHYQDDTGSSVCIHPQGLAQSEVSVQAEVPGQAQDCNQVQNNINIQTSVKVQGLSKFHNAFYEKQEQFTTNILDESPPILSLTRDKTIKPHLLNIMENLNILNPKEKHQKYSTVPSTSVPISSQTRHKSVICPTDLKSTMGPRVMNLKAKKPSFSQLLNIPGYGTSANRRKLEWNIAKSDSACEMNPWNALQDSALKAIQASMPSSFFGHSTAKTKRDTPIVTKIKSPLQVPSKKPPGKISYAQPLEKTPPSVENRGEFKQPTDTSTLSSEYSDSKTQRSKNCGMTRAGLTVNNKENSRLPYTNKIEFLALEQDAQRSKYVHQTILNSVSFPKKFSFQPEKAKKINEAIDPETFKTSNSLGKEIPNKADMLECDCSRSGKRLKLFISRQPRVVLKSFLSSVFTPVKFPLQSEKQKKSEGSGENMNRIIQDQSPGEEISLTEVECKPLLASQTVASLQVVPARGERSLIKAQLLECDSPRDSTSQGNYANQQEWFAIKQEGQQDQKCLPLTISKSGSEQTSEDVSEDSKDSVCPLSCEEIKRSLESHIKATDVLQSIYTTVPILSQIKIKYVKIMEDKDNSVCIPLICEEIKKSESKVETGVDSKCSNDTIPSLHPNTAKVADIKNKIPSPEIKRSESYGAGEIDSNLAKSDTCLKTITEETVADVNNNSMCRAPHCEEIKSHFEAQVKPEDSSESNITSMPCPRSTAIVHPVEDTKGAVASLVCEEIQKPPDDSPESRDACFCSSPSVEPNSLSLNCEEKTKRSLESHKTSKSVLESIFTSTPSQNSRKMKTVQVRADMSHSVCPSVGEEMQKSVESPIVVEPSDTSISLPLEGKKKSVQSLEDVKRSVCSPICDEIIKSLESHITEAVSNSIDASTHSPCPIKKKSVEVVLDLKKSLFSLPMPVETKRSLESYIKTGCVTESRGTSIPGPLQKRISQLASDLKNSAFPPPVCGEMQSSLEAHMRIPLESNWEIDRKTEKFPQEDTLLVNEGQEQIVADLTKEIQVSTHPGGRKEAFLEARGTVVAGYFKSQLRSISVLDRLTANEKTNLTFHFQKKRLELKQGTIHAIVIESYQKLPSVIKPCVSKEAHSDRRVFPRCRKLNFMSREEVDSLEMNLKHKYLMFLFGLPLNSQSSLKEIIPKATTPTPSTIYQKHKAKYIEKNVIVIKREVREELESHIREKQKLGFSKSVMSSLPQSFIPSPPKNICGPEEGSAVKRVICSLFIEGETKKSLPCYLRKMAAEQKGDSIPSKLMKCENATKELCPVSSMKAVLVNRLNVTNYVNENIKQAVEVNMQLRLKQKASRTPAENKGGSLPLVFQRFTANDLRKLITYFLVKTLEVKMSMIPGVVEKSIKMAENQVQRKPRLESVYPTNKVTKPRSTKLSFMEPKSLHQIILNLQHKCLTFLLGLPIETMSPKLIMPPKDLPRPKLNKQCKTVNEVGNRVCFSIDTEKLERHISFKKQNPYKIPPSIVKLLKSFLLSVCPSEYIPIAMDDRTILEKTLSLNCSSIVVDSQRLTQKDDGELSLGNHHWSLGEEKFNVHFKISPKLTKTVPDPPKDAPANTDSFKDSKVSGFQKVEICSEPQKSKCESPTTPKKTELVAQTNTDIVLALHETLPQKTENAPDFFEIYSEHSTSSSEICNIFETKKGIKANTDSCSLKASYHKTEVTFQSPENVQRSVELKKSPPPPKKREKMEMPSQRSVELKKSPPPSKKRVEVEMPSQRSVELKKSPPPPKKRVEMEMPFQTPNVIFRTFKKSWENAPLSDGGPLRQDQKEMYFDIPFRLEEFSPLEQLSKTNQVRTKTKPAYQKGDLIPQSIQASGSYSSLITTPYYKAYQHRKKKLCPKIHSPSWMSDSSLETHSMPYSLPREDKLSRKTWSHVSCPLASLADSSIKLKLETNDGKIILSLENKSGEKPNADLPKDNTMKLDPSCNFTESKEKQKKQEGAYDSGLESPEWHFLNEPESVLKHQQENDYFHFKRKNTQPFFYACTPADTPGNKSKTIRWNIPKNISGQSKFRIPLVAKFSNSEKMWSSSKKFLESVSAPFNLCPVHQK